jgi:hypothetical protein
MSITDAPNARPFAARPCCIPHSPRARAWLPLSSGTNERAMHLVVGCSFQDASRSRPVFPLLALRRCWPSHSERSAECGIDLLEAPYASRAARASVTTMTPLTAMGKIRASAKSSLDMMDSQMMKQLGRVPRPPTSIDCDGCQQSRRPPGAVPPRRRARAKLKAAASAAARRPPGGSRGHRRRTTGLLRSVAPTAFSESPFAPAMRSVRKVTHRFQNAC